MRSHHGLLREHAGIVIWGLWFADMLTLSVCARLSYIPVFGIEPLFPRYAVAIVFGLVFASLYFSLFSLYRAWRGNSQFEETHQVVLALGMTFVSLVVVAFLSKTSVEYSRVWASSWFVSSVVAVSIERALIRSLVGRLRRHGLNQRHIIIIGSGVTGERTLQHLLSLPESGFAIAGYFSDEAMPATLPENISQGSIADALRWLQQNEIDQVWFAMYLSQEDAIRRLLIQMKDVTADIRLVPGVFGVRLLNQSISEIAGLAVLNLSMSPMDGINRVVKAVQDRLLSAVILLLVSPVILLIALGVKLSSPGPVLFRQERVSWNGKAFQILKFRTMPMDIEHSTGATWAQSGEQRATSFGRILRGSSLDELPQFWNVLRGDMSIVGPRPERPVFVDKFKHQIPGYMQKHKVKAGITGWAQVNGWRGDTDLNRRIEHDLYYIDNWSLWLDLKIMLMTLFRGFVHKNAY